MEMQSRSTVFRALFPHVLGITLPNFTRKDTAADGALRTLSRIDGAFIDMSVADAPEVRI